MAQKLHAIFTLARNAFTIERLPPPPAPEATGEPRRSGLLRTMFAVGEPLPPPPPDAAERTASGGLFRMLFASGERLPPPPPPEGSPPPRRSVLRTLFAAEPLGVDPVVHRERRGRWLRWLFEFERLDPP